MRQLEIEWGEPVTRSRHARSIVRELRARGELASAEKVFGTVGGELPKVAYSSKTLARAKRAGVDLPMIVNELRGDLERLRVDRTVSLSSTFKRLGCHVGQNDARDRYLIYQDSTLLGAFDRLLGVDRTRAAILFRQLDPLARRPPDQTSDQRNTPYERARKVLAGWPKTVVGTIDRWIEERVRPSSEQIALVGKELARFMTSDELMSVREIARDFEISNPPSSHDDREIVRLREAVRSMVEALEEAQLPKTAVKKGSYGTAPDNTDHQPSVTVQSPTGPVRSP